MKNFNSRIISVIRSNKFFYVCLTIYILSVAWIALASIYPMAFDEEFHYGLIKIYATNWYPFGIENTPDLAQYGSALADPSYLFHYLMSYPYRLFDLLGLPDDVKIVLLRFINIGFVVGALMIFRRILLESKIGRATSNLAMLFFMFVPVLAMLSAQVNYDNLLMLVTAWILLLTLRVTRSVLSKKGFPATLTWIIVILLLFGMSIKYAFLPIAAGIGIWLVGLLAYGHIKLRKPGRQQLAQLFSATNRLANKAKIALTVFGVLGIFFASHYVINFVNYGSFIPACDQVFSEKDCAAYGPWNRDHGYVLNKNPDFRAKSLPEYIVVDWLPGMSHRLTFSVAGKTNGFVGRPGLPVLHHGFIILTAIGAVCLMLRLIFSRKTIGTLTWLTIVLTTLYCGALIMQLYSAYVKTSVPVAINGRYLLILLPLVAGVLMQSILHYAHKRLPLAAITSSTIVVIALFLISGAGANSYVLHAEPRWLWNGFGQDSHKVLLPVIDALTITPEHAD